MVVCLCVCWEEVEGSVLQDTISKDCIFFIWYLGGPKFKTHGNEQMQCNNVIAY